MACEQYAMLGSTAAPVERQCRPREALQVVTPSLPVGGDFPRGNSTENTSDLRLLTQLGHL
jgi:hypothetical protein